MAKDFNGKVNGREISTERLSFAFLLSSILSKSEPHRTVRQSAKESYAYVLDRRVDFEETSRGVVDEYALQLS